MARGTSAASSLALLVCFVPHLFCLFVTQQSGTIAVEICDHGRVGGRPNLTTNVKRSAVLFVSHPAVSPLWVLPISE